ncbi:MAG: shikimate dehydrogenase family protein, partial [Gemmatimonadaceae bacterium]
MDFAPGSTPFEMADAPRPRRLLLLGHPVMHSLSARFQNAAIERAGLASRYELLDVPPTALPGAVQTVRENALGGNITIPHKSAFAAYCDLLTPPALRAAAVNTFWIDGNARLVGDNTDVGGFDALASSVLGALPSGARVALLGAGGAAAAVCAATEHWPGATVAVWNRTRERAARLAARFAHVTVCDATRAAVQGAQIVVNATSIGAWADAMPLAPADLPSEVVVLDLVYRRGGTAFVRAARARG